MTDALLKFLISEYSHQFSGWDFSYITRTGRMSQGLLSWSYGSKILPKIRKVESLLDMGTGGGELLFSLQPLPKLTCATEGFAPNLLVARKKLEPIGVKVYEAKGDERLPFDDDLFELAINRHESYSPREVCRVLKSGGEFVTQQVGGRNDLDLRKFLGSRSKAKPWNLRIAVRQLQSSGMHIIEQKEEFPVMRFCDVGALVYYLKAVPWMIPDFSIKKYLDALRKLNRRIEKEGYLDVRNHRFFIVAQKP